MHFFWAVESIRETSSSVTVKPSGKANVISVIHPFKSEYKKYSSNLLHLETYIYYKFHLKKLILAKLPEVHINFLLQMRNFG